MYNVRHLQDRRYASLACNGCRESKIKVPLFCLNIGAKVRRALMIIVQWTSTKLFELEQKETAMRLSRR
jgi:hypothetical protein